MEIVVLILIIYFLPTINVLFNKNKSNKGSTIVINLFLGWTFVGWVIAFAISFGKD